MQLALLQPQATAVRASRASLQGRRKLTYRPRNAQAARRRLSCNAQVSPLVVDGVKYELCEAGERLKLWIIENGGVVHPGLAVVENAPSGSRGVICTESLDVDEIDNNPLLLVPEFLYMTSQVARVGFEYYEEQGAPPLGELDQATQLATLLAHERAQGEDSFYHPYVASLSEKPPNAWAMTDSELEAAIASQGREVPETWKEEAVRTRQLFEQHSQGAEDRYKKHFPITAQDFFWAMGHVLSRSFASHPQLGLAPMIDLCNHSGAACHPELAWGDEDQSEYFYFVTSARGGQTAPLGAGEELFIKYVEGNVPPKEAFMSYGFVPEELWAAADDAQQ
mmetsp:Transcript_12367/g.25987  ORF Transcript_12367/g.25987 Transcript_12367/m.25987 type:complete len:337 (-) Transcript_12367:219-1229(-)|eukprot:CAMPEP_0118938574 /NCGR_PEP_ID=MMETSP1169-20130426/26399_1 /TAXON_ID=36882 /ORGANISM="Pyramimonas obovata, Strain CCMP722" /LENGTH=336 /DNA_ID=CAMNT_0006882549 /DNA_START=83 /DNA_END=1093 /DNA_ORIENTATION=-